jgi:hypothetical protein
MYNVSKVDQYTPAPYGQQLLSQLNAQNPDAPKWGQNGQQFGAQFGSLPNNGPAPGFPTNNGPLPINGLPNKEPEPAPPTSNQQIGVDDRPAPPAVIIMGESNKPPDQPLDEGSRSWTINGQKPKDFSRSASLVRSATAGIKTVGKGIGGAFSGFGRMFTRTKVKPEVKEFSSIANSHSEHPNPLVAVPPAGNMPTTVDPVAKVRFTEGLLKSTIFQLALLFVIVLNAITLGIEVEVTSSGFFDQDEVPIRMLSNSTSVAAATTTAANTTAAAANVSATAAAAATTAAATTQAAATTTAAATTEAATTTAAATTEEAATTTAAAAALVATPANSTGPTAALASPASAAPSDSPTTLKSILTGIELKVAFLAVYVIELIIRIHAAGPSISLKKPSSLDSLLSSLDVLLLVDVAVIACIGADVVTNYVDSLEATALWSLSALRVLRLLSIILLLPLPSVCDEVCFIVGNLVGAVKTSLSTSLVLGSVVFASSIMFTKLLGHGYPEDSLIQQQFGTIPRSSLTLFAFATQQWDVSIQYLWDIDPAMVGALVVFIIVASIAILNLAIASIVRSTLQQAGVGGGAVGGGAVSEKLLEDISEKLEGIVATQSDHEHRLSRLQDCFFAIMSEEQQNMLPSRRGTYAAPPANIWKPLVPEPAAAAAPAPAPAPVVSQFQPSMFQPTGVSNGGGGFGGSWNQVSVVGTAASDQAQPPPGPPAGGNVWSLAAPGQPAPPEYQPEESGTPVPHGKFDTSEMAPTVPVTPAGASTPVTGFGQNPMVPPAQRDLQEQVDLQLQNAPQAHEQQPPVFLSQPQGWPQPQHSQQPQSTPGAFTTATGDLLTSFANQGWGDQMPASNQMPVSNGQFGAAQLGFAGQQGVGQQNPYHNVPPPAGPVNATNFGSNNSFMGNPSAGMTSPGVAPGSDFSATVPSSWFVPKRT